MIALALVLAAAPVSIAIPGVSCVGMQADLCESFLDRFVAVANETGRVKIIAQKDIVQLVGLERQKQLLGCAEGKSECLAELAGALGVDGLLIMSLTRSDPYYVATARILRARDGSSWVTGTERVQHEGELFDVMDSLARRFADRLNPDPNASAAPPVKVTQGRPGVAPWIPGGIGLAAVGVGVGLFLSASDERGKLLNHEVTGDAAATTANSGRFKEQLGIGLMAGGGAVVAASVVWILLSRSEASSSAALLPMPGGAIVVFGGALN